MNVSRRPDWADVRADARARAFPISVRKGTMKSLEGYEESDDI
jgi:hypothetical protein